MTVLEQVKEVQSHDEAKKRPESPSRVAAAVEAAYILEAVRK
jgi:hypothetical protein